MKKKHFIFMNCLCLAITSVLFISSCDEGSLEIPFYEFSKVSKCERDSIKTLMTYNNKELSQYEVLVYDNLVCNGYVSYTTTTISCSIKGIDYKIHYDNTRGGFRAETVKAYKDGALFYEVEYEYDTQGRLWRARLGGVEHVQVFAHYTYEEDAIVIDDVGTPFRIELSSRENIGYVCNVLDYADAPYTSTYIINPDLYFLNIYGAPVKRLPAGNVVEMCAENKQITRVGKYTYEYHN